MDRMSDKRLVLVVKCQTVGASQVLLALKQCRVPSMPASFFEATTEFDYRPSEGGVRCLLLFFEVFLLAFLPLLIP